MTYSILAREPHTGALGIAVQSKFPGVATLICHGEAGVGVIATQAFSNPEHGQRGLGLLRLGVPAEVALNLLLNDDPQREERQIAILTATGEQAQFTGSAVASWDGHATAASGPHAIAHGNSLTTDTVPMAMIDGYAQSSGDFAECLIAALMAGEAAGGELRGVQSAGVQVFHAGSGYGGAQNKPVDISIYDHADPIGELARCYRLHRLSYFPSDPGNLVPIEGDTLAFLRALMDREGYHPQLDGPWRESEVRALARFMGTQNYDNRIRDDDLIDTEVLADIKARRGL